jgi:hypothetical protein
MEWVEIVHSFHSSTRVAVVVVFDASYGRVVVLVVVGLVSRSMSSSRGTTIADDDDAWETTNAWRRHHDISCHHWDE